MDLWQASIRNIFEGMRLCQQILHSLTVRLSIVTVFAGAFKRI